MAVASLQIGSQNLGEEMDKLMKYWCIFHMRKNHLSEV